MRRLLTVLLCGLAAAVLVGGWPGAAAGVVVAVVLARSLRHAEPAARRRERLRIEADLPFAADLLAAALRAGLPTGRAVQAVADALAEPVGDRFGRVARSMALGLTPAQAWAAFDDVPAGRRLTTTVVRSADSGAALAGALSRLADDLRAARVHRAEAAARRAGVLIVLPLGLCFLPAFVFAGIVPVIVAVLGDVLRG
jgi:pilus assembly protein TadC